MEPRFAHPVERELAAVFDELGLVWEYEPRTFVLERDEEGFVTEAFTPDFYLPEQDVYVECTTMRQRLTARKNRKIRKLREQGVIVGVLYRRDFERLRERHGFPYWPQRARAEPVLAPGQELRRHGRPCPRQDP